MDDPASGNSFTAMLILLIVLVVLSCIFSISESSFLGINRLRLRILRNKKDRKAMRAGKLLDRKEHLINTLLVSNDIVNIFISSLITAVALKLFGQKGVGIATIVATVILLVFGEITPKTISTRCPDKIALALSGFLTFWCRLMHPVIFVVTLISRGILRLFGVKPAKKKQEYTEEEIKTFFDIGAETGALEKGGNSLMNRVFKFSDLEAQDIMIPRTKITAIPETSSYRDIIELSGRTDYTRFPVYRKSIDDIVGIVYLKDLLKFRTNTNDFSVAKVIRPPIFIPGTMKMSSVQNILSENRQSIAVVVDEYSGTDGLVTVKDISREIFRTPDETSLRGKVFAFETVENQEDFEINGSVLILDLKQALKIPLDSKINETIGGWFTEQTGRMPVPGDTCVFKGYRFIVRKVQSHRIERLQIVKLENESGEGEE